MPEGITLTSLRPGETGQIMSLATKNELYLRKLMIFGVLPGVTVEILQVYPVYVLRLGNTQLALDFEIAESIIVCT